MKNFVLKLFVLTLVIGAGGTSVFYYGLPQYNFREFPFLAAFYFAVTFLTHKILIKISEQRFAKFTTYFMGITVAKLLFYLVFIVAFVFLNKAKAKPFLVSFLSLYLVYTIFEVVSILSHFKSGQEQQNTNNTNSSNIS